jgi:hypothetical protein
MLFSWIRRIGPRAAAYGYVAYKWLEDHTDEVMRWSEKLERQAKGKSYEKAVSGAARFASELATWVDERSDSEAKRKK